MNLKQIISESNPSQSHTEMMGLLERIKKRDIATVLEIGVHRGGSFRVWQRMLRPELIIGLDNSWSGIQDIVDEIKDVEQAYILVPVLSQDQTTVKRVETLLKGRTIDFMFIDGDHTYEGVKADWDLYSPMLSGNAVVGFHDIMITDREDIGVHRLWAELKQLYNTYEFYCPEEQGTGTGLLYV